MTIRLMPPTEFFRLFAERFELQTLTDPHAGLFDELGMDSFAAIMMIYWIESLADPESLPDELPYMFTVQDAYDYYRLLSVDSHLD